jgi:hypothetical protein
MGRKRRQRGDSDSMRTSNAGRSVERAVAFFIRNRQSRQVLERDFVTPVRNRTRRGMQWHG